MFGTKKRTYGSKKSECGSIRHRDILRAVPDTNTLFDALSVTNIKKYRKDNSYLFPNRLSTISTARTKTALGTKKRKHRKDKSIINDVFLNSSPDASLHVKHNSIDLFDQLKNSTTKTDEAFDNLFNGLNVVNTHNVDPKLNLSTDSSSYSPTKQDSSKESSFKLVVQKKKKSYCRKQKPKPVLNLTTNGNTSHSIREFNFIVEPNGKNISNVLTPEAIVNCKENLWHDNEDSINFAISPIVQSKSAQNSEERLLADSVLNFDNLSTKNLLPSSTPYGKTANLLIDQKDESFYNVNSPMCEILQKDSVDIFNSFSDLGIEKELTKNQSQCTHKSNSSNNESALEDIDSKLCKIPVIMLEKLPSPESNPAEEIPDKMSEEFKFLNSESDSDTSFHGFPSETVDGKPESLCYGLSPRNSPVLHSPDLFSCASYEMCYDEHGFVTKSRSIVNEKVRTETCLTEDDVKLFKLETDNSNENSKSDRNDSSHTDPVNISSINKLENDSKILSESYDNLYNCYDDKISKMVPVVVLTRLENEAVVTKSCSVGDSYSKDDKLVKLIPRVVLTRFSDQDYMLKYNVNREIDNISSDISDDSDNLTVHNSPIRLRNKKTVRKNYGKTKKEILRSDEFDEKLTKMVPKVILTKISDSGIKHDEITAYLKTDTNICNEDESASNIVDKNDQMVYDSPIRLRNKKTVVRKTAHNVIENSESKGSVERLNDECVNLTNGTLKADESLNKAENQTKETFYSMEDNSLNQSLFDNTCMFVTKRAPTRFTDFNKTGNSNDASLDSIYHNSSSNISDSHRRSSICNYPIESYQFDNPRINTTKRDTMYRKTIAPRPSVILEPGKRWERSLNILRNMNRTNLTMNDSICGLNCTFLNNGAKKGRMYNQNVTHLLELQQNTEGNRDSIYDTTHHIQDALSNTRRYSVMIVEEPTLREEDFDESQVSQSSYKSSLYTDSCNDTKVSLSRVSLPESDRSKHRSVVLKREGHLELGEDEDHEQWSGVSARDIVLRRCNQSEPLPFDECYPPEKLRKCWKIGEGVYGEVFLYKNEEDPSNPIVMKVIPIEGKLLVNGDRQKTFGEIISEIVIAMELSDLRNNKENTTSAFNKVNRVRCVKGCYSESLIDLWELYDEQKGSENDNPTIFHEEQLYIVLELANGGKDLEAFQFQNAEQSYYLFFQIAFALAVAEESYQFEHRDLHWGNILISNTDHQSLKYRLRGEEYSVPTCDIQGCIIDYTLSRITLPSSHLSTAHTIYNDLSKDPDLFNADGDYQFEIYRLMKEKNGDSWQHFEPFTNILWLHYTLDKMITALRYQRTDTRIHEIFISKLSVLKDAVLQYDSCVDFVTSEQCFSLLHDI